MATIRAADMIKRRMAMGARRLGTRNPIEAVGGLIDRTFDLPLGDPRYGNNMLTPGALPLEHSFSELAGSSLRFALEPMGPGATPQTRRQEATREMRRLVHHDFGGNALRWFDERSEPWRGSVIDGRERFGAWFGAGFDQSGLQQSKTYYELKPDQIDVLPPNLQRATRVAMACLPGLTPIFTSIACGRRAGSQRVYLLHRGPLRLLDLEPMMRRLGVGHQHPAMLAALGLILGGRFTLPEGTVVLGLRDTSRGMELKVEILLPAFPDPPRELYQLINMHMAERPDAQRALGHWLQAMTPDEYASPGRVNVVGVRVNPAMGPRLSIYFQPVGYDVTRDETNRPGLDTSSRAPRPGPRDPYDLAV